MTTKNENKKRKYEQENRSFNNEWEENFFFIDNNGKALCVICNSTVKIVKVTIYVDIMKPIILSFLNSIHQIPN